MARKFYTLDVFTDQKLAGNPLAVVLDSEGLETHEMQRIAREFNLSETVFVSPPEDEQNHASIRIFTPDHELPFAGHPTVGTAILLNQLNQLGQEGDLVLEEKVGPVHCTISDSSSGKIARFGLPKTAEKIDMETDPEGWAKALGISSSDIGLDDHQLSIWDGGVPYTLVPVNSIDVVRAVAIDAGALGEVEPIVNGISANPYVYCMGGEDSDDNLHARMFAPNFGIPEDPATGSAVASLSGQLAVLMGDTEDRSFTIEQGYQMGRPSQIYLDISKQDGAVVNAGISGGAVIVSEGSLFL